MVQGAAGGAGEPIDLTAFIGKIAQKEGASGTTLATTQVPSSMSFANSSPRVRSMTS
jgi:hypothetical protein